MLSDSDINIDRTMSTNTLKRKASTTTKPQPKHTNASSSDAENRPITKTSAEQTKIKANRPTKADSAAPPKPSQSSSSPSGPAAKKAKLSSGTTPLVELKSGKLVLKQKAINWSGTLPVLKAVIKFQEFLDDQEKLDEIPSEHLHVIAKLAHESEKSLVELAKTIRNHLLPEAELGSSDSEASAASTSGKNKLSLPSIQAAINAVAERTNYGIDDSAIASQSSAEDAVTIPAALQLWRWEVKDRAMLPSDFLDKLTERRSEREAAREQARQLFNSFKEEDRQALLNKGVKSKISATVALDKPASSASASTPTPSKSKAKAKSGQGSASQPIAIDSDLDEGSVADTEHDAASGATAPSTPVASRKRKSPSSASTPQPSGKSATMGAEASTPSTSSSPKEKRKTKESAEMSPEKQKEKEEKEAAKAERLKAKEAKRLEREAKELEKQKAKEAKEAELKKAEEQKKRQANFFTSFVKKAAPKSPTKATAATALASGSSASGKAAETISDFDRTFLPCQYKDLAPINRFVSTDTANTKPQDIVQEDLNREEMLSQFLTRASVLKGSSAKPVRRRKGVHPPVSVREIKRIVTESDVLGGNAQEQAEKALETLQDRSKVQLKLLQFESDRRPGWYGTWTKSTNLISARCPLGQDPVSLDYSYDSDADWEEMGQVEGEDVQDGDGDEEKESMADEDEDSEMDDWLVDDLEVEEEEEQQRLAAMDLDDEIVEVDAKGLPVPPAPKIATTNLLHPKKKKKKVKLLGRRFDSKLVPFSTGPHWEAEFGKCEYELFSNYRIEFLNDACFGLNPFTFTSVEPSTDATTMPMEEDTPTKVRKAALPAGGVLAALWGEANPASTSTPSTPSASTEKASGEFKHQLKSEAIPHLLKAIDGSAKTRAGLVDDLKELLDKLGMSASKNAIAERISAYAKKEKKGGAPWKVNDEFRSLMG